MLQKNAQTVKKIIENYDLFNFYAIFTNDFRKFDVPLQCPK